MCVLALLKFTLYVFWQLLLFIMAFLLLSSRTALCRSNGSSIGLPYLAFFMSLQAVWVPAHGRLPSWRNFVVDVNLTRLLNDRADKAAGAAQHFISSQFDGVLSQAQA